MNYKLRKDERGISQVLMIIIAVVVLGGIGYAGWTVKNKDSGSSTASLTKEEKTALKTVEKECLKSQDNDKDLCKFLSNWSLSDKYAVTMVTTESGKTTNVLMKNDGKNTYMKTDGEFSMEVITMGDTTYTKAGDTWWKQTTKKTATDTTATTPTTDDYKYEAPKADTPESAQPKYVKVGKEACGKYTCFKYKMVDPTSKDVQYIWFDDDSYQVRKLRMESATGSVNEMTYSYDNVKVGVPSPVKELGANQYIMPGTTEVMTMPSAADFGVDAATTDASTDQ